jgi:glycosyltransferase involved in cell wall biosynthesis
VSLLRPARVLFLLPGLAMGGAERHAIDLLQRMRRAGHQAGLVAHGLSATPEMVDIARSEGVVALRVKGMSSPLGWLRTWRELRRQNADVILCINQTVAVVAVVLRGLRLVRGKVACIFHTTVLEPNDQARFYLFRWIVRWVDALVFVSRTQQGYWEASGLKARRNLAIPNGVDLRRFGDEAPAALLSRESLGIAPEDYVIGIVAALRPEKNHEELIEALAVVRRTIASAKLLIVGGGGTEERIRARVQALGLQDQVVFAGVQSDVRPYIRLCDVCVLCSYTETFPLVALEILALNVPMVSSAVGAMPQIIRAEENGLLYPSGDPAALADRLLRLAEPAVRAPMAAAARASVLGYDVEVMAGQYEVLIDALSREG